MLVDLIILKVVFFHFMGLFFVIYWKKYILLLYIVVCMY